MTRGRDPGFTLIELLIVIAIIAIITAFATAGLLRSKAAANESSAISSMRITNSAQSAYAVACGRGAFAASYLVLGTPPPGGGPAFVSSDLGANANPQKSGYRFAMTAGAGSTAGPVDCNGSRRSRRITRRPRRCRTSPAIAVSRSRPTARSGSSQAAPRPPSPSAHRRR
jgi:prepilin-type N-terminal cleavage/methylation domain-containing protein